MGESINIDALISGAASLRSEIVLVVTLLLIIVLDLIKRSDLLSRVIFVVGVLGSLIFLNPMEVTQSPWSHFLSKDSGSVFASWILAAAALFVALMGLNRTEKHPGEYYSLLLTMLIGSYLVVSSTHFLTIVIGLEMISIPSYILTGFRFNKKGAEGAIKYFLFGAASTAVLLYGISFFYGITGGFELTAGHEVDYDELPLNGALILIVSGLLFKVAAVPMHIWLPDIYESAPTPVVAYFSVVPKVAGLIVLGRLMLWYNSMDSNFMLYLIGAVAVGSMVLGNFAALRQTGIKRMLGYSSIAHSGFLIMALLSFDTTGLTNLLFYLAVYTIMSFGAFMLVEYLEENHGVTTIPQLRGSGKYLSMVGVIFGIHLVALTGLPPTAGFMAKFLVFTGMWESYLLSGQITYIVLLVLGILNTIVALFYYIKIPFEMFLKPAEAPMNYKPSASVYVSTLLAVLTLLLFFIPGMLIEVFNNITFVL